LKVLKQFFASSSDYDDFCGKGWDNPTFLSLISPTELIGNLKLTNSSETKSIIQKTLEKIKKKEGITGIDIRSEHFNDENIQWEVSTGSDSLDQMLDGNGVQSGRITLFYGKFRSGKSQIAHQCCVNVYNLFKEISDTKISLFLDTENTFRPERITQMAIALGLNPDKVLKSIWVIHLGSASEFDLLFQRIENFIEEQNIKLIVVDSLTNFYREELAKEKGSLKKVIEQIMKHLEALHSIAETRNLPVICTSQVTAAMSKTSFFNITPILSTTLNVFIKQWILLAEDESITNLPENSGRRSAHLINGEQKKEQNVQYILVNEGVRDYYG